MISLYREAKQETTIDQSLIDYIGGGGQLSFIRTVRATSSIGRS